jgi:hypothetical protein
MFNRSLHFPLIQGKWGTIGVGMKLAIRLMIKILFWRDR